MYLVGTLYGKFMSRRADFWISEGDDEIGLHSHIEESRMSVFDDSEKGVVDEEH